METRTEIAGLSRREAHANLQRHIRRTSTNTIVKTYSVRSAKPKAKPLTFWEAMTVAAIMMLRA